MVRLRQYYPDYAYNHQLFTQRMKLYSDSKVSSFINGITRDQCIAFQNEWNSRHDQREKSISLTIRRTRTARQVNLRKSKSCDKPIANTIGITQ